MIFFKIKGGFLEKKIDKYKIYWDGPSASKFQYNCKQFFKTYWEKHHVYEELPCFGCGTERPLRMDLFSLNKRICVEVNGDFHTRETKFFHNKQSDFLDQIARDEIKRNWLKLNKITLIEIFPNDLPLSLEKIEKLYGQIR